jgi:hypothetical protein
VSLITLIFVLAGSPLALANECSEFLAEHLDFGRLTMVSKGVQVPAIDPDVEKQVFKLNPDQPSLLVTTTTRVPSPRSGEPKNFVNIQAINLASGVTRRPSAPESYRPIRTEHRSRSHDISLSLSPSAVETLKAAMKKDLGERGFASKNPQWVVNDISGPVHLFSGPIAGTFLLTSAEADPLLAERPGRVILLNYLRDSVVERADVELPMGFRLTKVKVSADQIALIPTQGPALFLTYVVGSQTRLAMRGLASQFNDWRNWIFQGGSWVRLAQKFSMMREIAIAETDRFHPDIFTGSAVAELEGRLYGVRITDDASVLLVVSAQNDDILLTRPLDPAPVLDRGAGQERYGVRLVLKAPATGGYAKEGIRYIVILTDGSLYTLNQL